MWRRPGSTKLREAVDQSYAINWGGSAIRLPFQKLTQVGFLRGIVLDIPAATSLVPIGTNGLIPDGQAAGTYVAAGATVAQLAVYRAIQRISLKAQGISPLIDNLKGTDLAYLEAVRNGDYRKPQPTAGTPPVINGFNAQYGFNGAASANPPANYDKFIGSVAPSATGSSQLVSFGLKVELPVTEHIRFTGAAIKDAAGNVVNVGDQELEVGFLALQNVQQNISPEVWMNPLWTAPNDPTLGPPATSGATAQATYADAPFWAAAADAPTAAMPITAQIITRFFDVPQSPLDWPSPQQMAWVVSRTANEVAIPSSGKVTYNFQQAGLLLRAIYVFYDANYNILDVSACQGNITFKWGSSEIKTDQPIQENAYRALQRYGGVASPPPSGLYHDFLYEGEGSLSEAINTADLTAVRTEISGLTKAGVVQSSGNTLAGYTTLASATPGAMVSGSIADAAHNARQNYSKGDNSTGLPATPVIMRVIEERLIPVTNA